MFECNECRLDFDKPETLVEKEYADYGIGGEWLPIYVTDVCPNCGSEDYREIDDEDACTAEQDEVLGVGLHQATAVENDG